MEENLEEKIINIIQKMADQGWAVKNIRRVISKAYNEHLAGKGRTELSAKVRNYYNALKELPADISFELQGIVNAVAEASNRTPENIITEHLKTFMFYKHVALYLAYKKTSLPLTVIALFFGLRDHTAVIYARKRVLEEINTNSDRREFLETLDAKFPDKVRPQINLAHHYQPELTDLLRTDMLKRKPLLPVKKEIDWNKISKYANLQK